MEHIRITDSPLHTFGQTVLLAEQKSHEIWRAVSGDGAPSLQQYLSLAGIGNWPGSSQHELADALSIDRGSFSPLLVRLEKVGLIERVRDKRDGRKSTIFLCDEGIDMARQLHERAQTAGERLLDALTKTEQIALVHGWRAVAGRMDPPASAEEEPTREFLPPLVQTPLFPLRCAARRYRAIWRSYDQGLFGTTVFALLVAIDLNPGCDIRTAGRIASVEESTAVRSVMRLVRLHYLTERRDAADGRRTLLTLTERGQAEHDRLVACLPEIQQKFSVSLRAIDQLEIRRLTESIL